MCKSALTCCILWQKVNLKISKKIIIVRRQSSSNEMNVNVLKIICPLNKALKRLFTIFWILLHPIWFFVTFTKFVVNNAIFNLWKGNIKFIWYFIWIVWPHDGFENWIFIFDRVCSGFETTAIFVSSQIPRIDFLISFPQKYLCVAIASDGSKRRSKHYKLNEKKITK